MLSTTTQGARFIKRPGLPDPEVPSSLQKIFYKGSPFLQEHEDEVNSIIDEQRANIDMPYDELYHR